MSTVQSERLRLIPPGVILTFGALILFALILVFPRERIERRLLIGSDTDTLTIAYLQAWLQVDPNNQDILTALTTEYLKGNQLGNAEQLLRRMRRSMDPAVRQSGLLIQISVTERRAYETPEHSDERRVLLATLDDLLTQAVHLNWARDQFELLADKAVAVGDGPLSGEYFRQLAQLEPDRIAYWRGREAVTQLASSHYREAADADFAAMAASDTLAQRRTFYLDGLRALQSGGLLAEAMAQAEAQLGPLANDDDTLRFLARLALACGRPDLAERYAHRLLKMSLQHRPAAPLWHYATWRSEGAMQFGYARWDPSQRARVVRVAQPIDATIPAADFGNGGLSGPLTGTGAATLTGRPAKPLATLAAPLPVAPAGGSTGALAPAAQAPRLADAVAQARGTTAAPVAASGAAPIAGSAAAGTPAAAAARAAGNPGAAAAAPATGPDTPLSDAPAPANKTFNADDFELAFKVFLANGNVRDAQAVAQSAVRQRPDLPVWRERLAQVAEWNNQPAVALQSYLALAKLRGDDKSWQQVLRLAPALNDAQASLAAFQYEAQRTPSDLALTDKVVNAYELLADYRGGLAWLAQRAQGALRRPLLERYAALAERAGDDDLAFNTYQTLEHDFGPSPAYALKLSLLYYQRTDFSHALSVLADARSAARPADDDFWRFYALLGQLVQHRQAAVEGYRALLQGSKTTPDDLSLMIDFFQRSPLDAGRLAEFAYRHGNNQRALVQAIYSYTRAHATLRVQMLLASLTPEQRAAAEATAAFRLARSEYEAQTDRPDLALADVRAALQISPDALDAGAAYIFLLTERGSAAELQSALRRYARDAQDSPPLWGAYAAASLRLGDASTALHYFHKQAATRHDDPLWQLSFADALELSGAIDEAYQVRRRVWNQLHAGMSKGTLPDGVSPDQRDDLRARFVGLTDLFKGGDASARVLIELLRQDRLANAEPTPANAASELGDIGQLPPAQAQAMVKRQQVYSAAAREAVLAWAQSHDEYALERAWLERQYIDRLTRPAYATITLALAERDVGEMNRLLDEMPDRIPLENKIDAEAITGRLTDAQTDAFEAQQRLPDNNTVNAALREQTLLSAQSVGPSFRTVRGGALSYTETSAGAGVRLNANTALTVNAIDRLQHGDPASLPGVPSHDRTVEAQLRHFTNTHTEALTIGRRQSLSTVITERLEGTFADNQTLSFNYSAGHNQYAPETQAMQVGGVKDMVTLGANYRPDPHIFTSVRAEYDRFYGQDRSFLGSGVVVDAQAGYKLRIEYPDYTIRVVLTHAQYNATGTPGAALGVLTPDPTTPATADQFVPHSFSQAALLFGFGTDLITGYSQAWRPFFEAGPMQDSRAGLGEQVSLGMVGSLLGADQMSVYFAHSSVSQTGSSPVTELGVHYRWLY